MRFRARPSSTLKSIQSPAPAKPSAGFNARQPEVPAASSVDPRLSLNNQAWPARRIRQRPCPLRVRQRLAGATAPEGTSGRQRLHTNDRIRIPVWLHRHHRVLVGRSLLPRRQFDLYDFPQRGERRNTRAFELQATGSVDDRSSSRPRPGHLRSQFTRAASSGDHNTLAQATSMAPPSRPPRRPRCDEKPTATDGPPKSSSRPRRLNANRRLARAACTPPAPRIPFADGSACNQLRPVNDVSWIAVSHAPTPTGCCIASWGRGAESEVTPNRSRYQNAGRALPVLANRQREVGIRRGSAAH